MNELRIFEAPKFGNIRTIGDMFVAADVARALGYRMASDMTRRPDCHQNGPRAVHRCRETDLMIKRKYHRIFEETHTRVLFIGIFGRNYL